MLTAFQNFLYTCAISFDLPILDWIQANMQSGFMDKFMPFITKFGDEGIFWIAVAVVLFLFPKTRKIGLGMGFAMIIGLLPLMFASGVGKNGNQTLGAAAVGGMLIGTLCQVFVVPSLFAVCQWLQERFRPIDFTDNDAQIDTELLQYTRPGEND